MQFTMSGYGFRCAVYKDLTRVQECTVDGQRMILASCPNCTRMVVRHPLDASAEDNASAILKVYDHMRGCPSLSRKP